MLRSDFDYHLPEELIAQEPLAERDQSRMLILDRGLGEWTDGLFAGLPQQLVPGDLLVINNTRVFPARLLGYRMNSGERGRAVEVLLLARADDDSDEWDVVAKPGRILKPGVELEFGNGLLKGVVTVEKGEGRRRVRFEYSGEFGSILEKIGRVPLPPYIKRPGRLRGDNSEEALDRVRYQTVFASRTGSIAAPTAGLHFTPPLIERLRTSGIGVAEITHHVGYATFQPVRAEQVEDHRIEEEAFEIGTDAVRQIDEVRGRGGRVIAVGTTVVRALESAVDPGGRMRSGSGRTYLFIYPGYRFQVVSGILTNFHLPESSLLMLVAAFGGRDMVLAAYRHAVAKHYRFYSYGDCMLVI